MTLLDSGLGDHVSDVFLQKRRLDQPFSHHSDRSFMINYVKSCAPRAVSSHLNRISCLMMAVLFLCRDQGLCNKNI